MFWDKVAGVYDIYVNVINRKTHIRLKKIVADLIEPDDVVLECACGTGLLSGIIALKCRKLTATDYSLKMLKKAQRNCRMFKNITYAQSNINSLSYSDNSFDKVVAANVIHLLDDPVKAVRELDRVCKDGGTLIIPTYINKDKKGKVNGFVETVGKAGADFKKQFTVNNYRKFFIEAGYKNVSVLLADGFIPCAVAVIKKEPKNESI